MAITQVGTATTAGDASGGSITITKPTGVASGDVLVAVLTGNNQVPNVPSGWAIQTTQQATATGNSFWCHLAYKVAGGSEGASYNFTYSDTSAGAPFFGSITAWRGVDNVTPFGGVNSSSSGDAGEPHSSGTISNNAVVAGRAFYSRHCRSSGSPAATVSQSSGSGGISELVDGGQSSGAGGTRYQHAMWAATADFSTVGPPAAITSMASATETDSIWITWTLEVAPVSAPATVAPVTATAYNVDSVIASTNATQGPVTATAYDAVAQFGIAAENVPEAPITVTAYNAMGWIIFPVDVGVVAFNPTVAITTAAERALITTGTPGSAVVNVFDTFNRADNASSLGTSDSGHTWTQPSAGAGIQSNAAYKASGAPVAVIDTGNPDGTLTVTCTNTPTTLSGLSFRHTGSGFNSWYFRKDSTSKYRLDYFTGATVVVGSGLGPDVASGDVLKVVLNGPSIKCYVNDVLVYDVIDTQYLGNTKHGLHWNSGFPTFDNFGITLPAVQGATGYFGAPPSRKLRIPAENRSWRIAAESRTWRIPSED